MTNTPLGVALEKCRTSFISVGVFSGVANLLMLVPAFFMLNVYDKAVGHNSLDTLWVLSALTAFLFLILCAMEIIRSRVLIAVSTRLDKILAPDIYKSTFANTLKIGGANANTQPLIDLNNLRQFICGNGVFALFDAPWLPIYLLVLFLFHPLLGWMGLLATGVFLVLAVANQIQTEKPLATAGEAARENNIDTLKNFRNAEVIASMGMLPEMMEKWQEKQDRTLYSQQTASNTAGVYNAIIKTARIAIQSAAIAAGAYLVLEQEISPGMLIAGSILIGRALAPVEIAVGAWKGFLAAREQYGRLNDLLSSEMHSAESEMQLPNIEGRITANQAAVVPPGSNTPTIAQVSFEIPAGSVCAVLGNSGSGKSTLVRAILGIWPTIQGDLRLDGTEAHKHPREALGKQIGYLPQDIELLEGTVAENISRFGAIDSEKVIQAATDAGVHEFILSLEHGYDTELSAAGASLSAGQRQRVALARALYGRPKLVVLDEPNSNLDTSGEEALNVAIEGLKREGSTVIVVTHRSSVVEVADFLLVMAAGTVSHFGRPAREGAIAEGVKEQGQKDRDAVDRYRSSTEAVKTVTWRS